MNRTTFVNYFDYLGLKPRLYINKRDRDATLIGAITTLLVGCGMISLALTYLYYFFIGEDKKVIFSYDNLKETISFDLNQRVFMIQVLDNEGITIDPRIGTLNVIHFQFEGSIVTKKKLDLEPCVYEKHIKKESYDQISNNTDISSFLCLSPINQAVLSHDISVISGSYITVYLSKCNNNKDGKNCLPEEEIDKNLNEKPYYFLYYIENSNINHDQKDPFGQIPMQNNYLIVPSIKYDYTLYWKSVKYRSDGGWFFNNWKTYRAFQHDESLTDKTIHQNSRPYEIDKTFQTFKFRLHRSSINYYERSYPKLQTILVNVSALMKLFIFFGKGFVNLFVTGSYYLNMYSLIQNEPIKTNNKIIVFNRLRIPTIQTKKQNKKNKPTKCMSSCIWMFLPKANEATIHISMCRKKIVEYLSTDNIIKKIITIEEIEKRLIAKKERTPFHSLSSLLNNQNKSQRNNRLIKHDSYFTSIETLIPI